MRKSRNLKAVLSVLLALFFVAVTLTAGTTHVYAYTYSEGTDPVPASGTWGTCAWDIDANGVLTIHSGTGVSLGVDDAEPWYNYRKNIKSVVATEQITCPGSLGSLFEDCSNMVTADVSGFDTSGTYWLQRYHSGGQGYGIFTGCTSLTTIKGLDKWDTSNFINISSAFLQCESLTSLSGLENWDVSHVTDMEATFRETSSVTDYSPVSGWDTSSVQDMTETFLDSGLTDLHVLSGWDTSNVTTMHSIFMNCQNLTDMSGLENWSMSSNETIVQFVAFCSSLREITVPSGWDFSNVEDLYNAFNSRSISKMTFSSNFHTKETSNYFLQDYGNNPFGTPTLTYSGKESDGTWGLGSEDAETRYTRDELFEYGKTHDLTGTWYAQVKKNTTPQTYTVHFIANGGTGEMADQTITVGESTALTANAFTADGFTFAGWNTKVDGSGTSYADGEEVTDLAQADGSVALYAQWKLNEPVTYTYTVHYDANGGSGEMADQTITVGENTALTTNAFTRSGYTFTAWNTAADGSGTFYYDGVEVMDLAQADESVTLYAQWEKSTPKTYTVHFDANGGSGEMADQTITTGVSTALTANAFSRSGYTFIGWSTGADGNGIYYADQAQVKDFKQADSNVTLYAQWEQNPSTSPVYKIIKGDGQTWTKGTSTGISMTANGPIGKFVGLLIDGSKVAQFDSSADSGSTVITTTAAYAELLAPGQHTLTVQYTDGSAAATFYVAEKQTDATEEPAHGEDVTKQDDTTQPASDVGAVASDDSVNTGDSLRGVLYLVIMIACAALIITLVFRRSRNNKEQ
ncbi:MAG: InlB B-repeat-containing protein [Lachnospiraceae bacterium]|jgi:uncharacterized repeat protein (TIGR02543 family)